VEPQTNPWEKESTKIKIEIVKLTYPDFRDLLLEFYNPQARSLPKSISELIVWGYLQKQGFKALKLIWSRENEHTFMGVYHTYFPEMRARLPDGRWAVVISHDHYLRIEENRGTPLLNLDDEENWRKWRELFRTKQLVPVRGTPDFIAYRSPTDFIFAEAKSEEDTVRLQQLKWIAKHPSFRVVFFVVEARWRWLHRFAEEIGEKDIRILPGAGSEKILFLTINLNQLW